MDELIMETEKTRPVAQLQGTNPEEPIKANQVWALQRTYFVAEASRKYYRRGSNITATTILWKRRHWSQAKTGKELPHPIFVPFGAGLWRDQLQKESIVNRNCLLRKVNLIFTTWSRQKPTVVLLKFVSILQTHKSFRSETSVLSKWTGSVRIPSRLLLKQ